VTKSASAGLIAHLGGETTSLAVCWKVTRRDGAVLGFTDHDRDLTIDADGAGAVTYRASTVLFQRSGTAAGAAMGADSHDVEGVLDSAAIGEADIRAGRYDGAQFAIFMVNWADTSQGVIKLARGLLGQVELKDFRFSVEARSLKLYYQEQIVDLFSPRCIVELFGAECGALRLPAAWQPLTSYALGDLVIPSAGNNGYRYRATVAGTSASGEPAFPTILGATVGDGGVTWTTDNGYVKSGTVGVATSRKLFEVQGLTDAPDDYFNGGYITFASGNNDGLSREIVDWTADASPETHSVDLFLPLPFDVTPGDAATLTIGCDKTLETCRDTFGNVVNFRGFPYVPGNQEMLRSKQ
jgi:hypothetical protein